MSFRSPVNISGVLTLNRGLIKGVDEDAMGGIGVEVETIGVRVLSDSSAINREFIVAKTRVIRERVSWIEEKEAP